MREIQNVLDRVLAAMIPKTGPTKAQMRWFSEDNQHLQPRTELMYYVYDNSSYCWLMLYCHYIIVIIIAILVVVIITIDFIILIIIIILYYYFYPMYQELKQLAGEK